MSQTSGSALKVAHSGPVPDDFTIALNSTRVMIEMVMEGKDHEALLLEEAEKLVKLLKYRVKREKEYQAVIQQERKKKERKGPLPKPTKRGREGTMTIDAVTDTDADLSRPPAYVADGVKTVRISVLGWHPHIIAAGWEGYVASDYVPAWLQEIFDEGHVVEPMMMAWLKRRGYVVGNRGTEVVFDVDGVRLVGHMDGTIDGPQGFLVVDAKSLGEETFTKLKSEGVEGFPTYKWQLSGYFWGLKAQGQEPVGIALVGKHRGTGESYLTQPIKPYVWQEMQDRVQEFLAADSATDSCTRYPCPYHFLHLADEPTGDVSYELRALLERYRTTTVALKELEEQKKAIAEELVGLLPEKGVRVGSMTAKPITVANRKVINHKQIIEDYNVDVSRYERPMEPYSYVMVRDRRRE